MLPRAAPGWVGLGTVLETAVKGENAEADPLLKLYEVTDWCIWVWTLTVLTAWLPSWSTSGWKVSKVAPTAANTVFDPGKPVRPPSKVNPVVGSNAFGLPIAGWTVPSEHHAARGKKARDPASTVP